MAASAKRVYWDACAWIALIQREKIYKDGSVFEDRDALCRAVIAHAKKGNIEVVTSSLSLVEVCKNTELKENASEDVLASYFESDYILLVNLDRCVGLTARQLMLSKHTGLKPPDAIHVATAAIASVDEMHTFDSCLLDLDGKIAKQDGGMLKICKPSMGGPTLPLLAKVENA